MRGSEGEPALSAGDIGKHVAPSGWKNIPPPAVDRLELPAEHPPMRPGSLGLLVGPARHMARAIGIHHHAGRDEVCIKRRLAEPGLRPMLQMVFGGEIPTLWHLSGAHPFSHSPTCSTTRSFS